MLNFDFNEIVDRKGDTREIPARATILVCFK